MQTLSGYLFISNALKSKGVYGWWETNVIQQKCEYCNIDEWLVCILPMLFLGFETNLICLWKILLSDHSQSEYYVFFSPLIPNDTSVMLMASFRKWVRFGCNALALMLSGFWNTAHSTKFVIFWNIYFYDLLSNCVFIK